VSSKLENAMVKAFSDGKMAPYLRANGKLTKEFKVRCGWLMASFTSEVLRTIVWRALPN
jgi:hypothetical protein